MKRIVVGVVIALVATMMFVTPGAAQPDRDDLLVETLVDEIRAPLESRTTANGKWMFFEDKFVGTFGRASIGAAEYEATIDAWISGKLTADLTEGAEWAEFTLRLEDEAENVVECAGTFFVKRFPAEGPVGYAEAGHSRGTCDDGSKIEGDVVAEWGSVRPNVLASAAPGLAMREWDAAGE